MALATDQWLIFIVRLIHIVAGVAWVGGIAYMGLVVSKSLASAPPAVRGPAMGHIGPVGFRFLTWAGTLTIIFGAINQVLIAQRNAAPGPEWHMVLGIAFMIGVVMLGIAGAIISPSLKKMAQQPPPEVAIAIQGRLTKASMANLGLGLIALVLMVYATKLRVV